MLPVLTIVCPVNWISIMFGENSIPDQGGSIAIVKEERISLTYQDLKLRKTDLATSSSESSFLGS